MVEYFLLEQLHSAVGEGEYIEKIQYSPYEKCNVLMLTGVCDVFPFMRVHILLETLQQYFWYIPILALYPGEFDGHHMKLFNRLQPTFMLIDESKRSKTETILFNIDIRIPSIRTRPLFFVSLPKCSIPISVSTVRT
ncbi:MAG: DUF1788 domain-containing protein [Synergistaceae bacterium]|nr:DUF1788 domain-containing protein [Synergistaceae bacterium]